MQNESCIWNKTFIVALLFKPLLLLLFLGTMGFYAPNSCVHHVYLEGVHCSGKSLEDKNLGEVQDYSVGAGPFFFFFLLSSLVSMQVTYTGTAMQTCKPSIIATSHECCLLFQAISSRKFSVAKQPTGRITILYPVILPFLNLVLFWPLIRSLSKYCIQLLVNHCHSPAPG